MEMKYRYNTGGIMDSYRRGGPVKRYDHGGEVDPLAGAPIGQESSLSNWAGPYVTDMLGRGKALADNPYTAYTGPLTAGQSDLQGQAFGGVSSLTIPQGTDTTFSPTSFTSSGTAEQFMSPYMSASVEPQLAEAQRQSEIQQMRNRSRLTQAGAYGGSRSALMASESQRNLLRNMSDITGRGYQEAYESGRGQFNTEQDRMMGATENNRRYGLAALQSQLQAGDVQQGITAEGVMADRSQFEEERDYPYKQTQFMQSLLQGLPVATQSYSYAEPSSFSNFLAGSGGIAELINSIFKIGK